MLEFQIYLKHQRRKASAIEQIVAYVTAYEVYLQSNYPLKALHQATPESLESYISWIESETGKSASKPLWALRYYFDFIDNRNLSVLAGEMRAERIKHKPFKIRDFRGVDPGTAARFTTLNIEYVDQMLDAGRTPKLREALAEKTGLSREMILELVKLSDLSRLGAVRSVRARLYHDAGLTPESIATWEPQPLRAMLVAWVEKHDFDGIAPLPKEVQNLVNDARRLPQLVVY